MAGPALRKELRVAFANFRAKKRVVDPSLGRVDIALAMLVRQRLIRLIGWRISL